MTDREMGFLSAVADAYDDDAPRLLYADWLDERGDPRGEFIRIQCLLASGKDEAELLRRQSKLLEAHRNKWLADVPMPQVGIGSESGIDGQFERGFITINHYYPGHSEYTLTSDQFCNLPLCVLPLNPNFIAMNAEDARKILSNPRIIIPQRISIDWRSVWRQDFIREEGAEAIANAAPNMLNLKHLSLCTQYIGDAGFKSIMEAKFPIAQGERHPKLTRLDVSGNQITDKGMGYLADSPFYHLKELNVSNNLITNAGVKTFVGSKVAKNLTSIIVDGISVSSLIDLTMLPNMETIHTSENLCRQLEVYVGDMNRWTLRSGEDDSRTINAAKLRGQINGRGDWGRRLIEGLRDEAGVGGP